MWYNKSMRYTTKGDSMSLDETFSIFKELGFKKFYGYPKPYRKTVATKLLYLYKTGVITRTQWQRARFFNVTLKIL